MLLGVFPLALVRLAELRAELLVVPLDRVKGFVGDALFEEGRRGTQKAIAHLHMVVEKRQRLPRLHGFQPQGHTAKLRGHGV